MKEGSTRAELPRLPAYGEASPPWQDAAVLSQIRRKLRVCKKKMSLVIRDKRALCLLLLSRRLPLPLPSGTAP